MWHLPCPTLHSAVIFTARLSVTFTFCTHNLESSFVWILYLNRFPSPTLVLLSWGLSHPRGGLVLRVLRSWRGPFDGGAGLEKRQWGEEPTPAPQPGLQAVLAWTGSQQASTPLNCAVAPSTPSATARQGWSGTRGPSEGAWLTRWSLEAAWGISKGVPPSGGPSCPAWKVVRTAEQEATAQPGWEPTCWIWRFSYFLNFETLQTPIEVVQASREHHLDSPALSLLLLSSPLTSFFDTPRPISYILFCLIFILIHIYLAAAGLGWGTQDLLCPMWDH